LRSAVRVPRDYERRTADLKYGGAPYPIIRRLADDADDQVFREDPPTYSQDGVDLTLIRWMLSLTPAERLEVLQENVCSLIRLRGDETETWLRGHPSDPG
jgi:hypothetical protein